MDGSMFSFLCCINIQLPHPYGSNTKSAYSECNWLEYTRAKPPVRILLYLHMNFGYCAILYNLEKNFVNMDELDI